MSNLDSGHPHLAGEVPRVPLKQLCNRVTDRGQPSLAKPSLAKPSQAWVLSLGGEHWGSVQGMRVTRVAAGAEHCLAVTANGDAYSWGWGRYGNIGDSDRVDRCTVFAGQGRPCCVTTHRGLWHLHVSSPPAVPGAGNTSAGGCKGGHWSPGSRTTPHHMLMPHTGPLARQMSHTATSPISSRLQASPPLRQFKQGAEAGLDPLHRQG